MILLRFPGKTGDDVSAQPKHRHALGQPFDARAVRRRRVPMPPHPLEHEVRSRLQRGMEMRGQMPWRFHEEMRECVVDFSPLTTRKGEADLGKGVDESLQQRAKSFLT